MSGRLFQLDHERPRSEREIWPDGAPAEVLDLEPGEGIVTDVGERTVVVSCCAAAGPAPTPSTPPRASRPAEPPPPAWLATTAGASVLAVVKYARQAGLPLTTLVVRHEGRACVQVIAGAGDLMAGGWANAPSLEAAQQRLQDLQAWLVSCGLTRVGE